MPSRSPPPDDALRVADDGIKHIAVAGFQHETNTFGATRATYAEFVKADSWPGLLRGQHVVPGLAGSNLPLAGFIRAVDSDEVALHPILWCSAEPAAHVTDDAFERICAEFLSGLRQCGHLDGLYLDLHGAMVTESHDDGEGELLRRVRAEIGDTIPIVISLDLHANLSDAMCRYATAMTVFRTYPHLDMANTGARAYPILRALIRESKPHIALRHATFLLPLHAQYTGSPPCDRLYAELSALDTAPGEWCELATGFPAADVHFAGPAVLAHAATAERAGELADYLLARVEAAANEFQLDLWSPDAAVAEAMRRSADARGPVVIADVQDNPGAGATSDTTGMLHALLEGGAQRAVLGMINDPSAARAAHEAGVGATLALSLGGKVGPAPRPLGATVVVEALSDGRFAFSGEMYAGSIAQAGPTALLRVVDPEAEVRVVVSSVRVQCLDQAIFRHIGIDPADQRIVVVKSTVHFRADFDPIAAATLVAAAPGLNPCRLDRVPYRKLREGVERVPSVR